MFFTSKLRTVRKAALLDLIALIRAERIRSLLTDFIIFSSPLPKTDPNQNMENLLDEIDLSPPHLRPGTPTTDHNGTTEESPCQRLVRTTASIKRFTAPRDGYKRIMETLEMDRSHNPDYPLYVKVQREHEEISALLEYVVSDFGSIPRCTTLGCPLHTSPANTPTHTPKASPPGTPRSHTKRHNDGFITPPASKTARKVLLKTPGMAPVSLENSIVRPNTSYAQAATQNTIHINKSRQATASSTQRAGNSRQTEAITAQQINPIPIQNYPLNAATNISIQQTLQIAMFALAQLSQAFSGASVIAGNLNQISAAHGNPNQLYGLIEASLNNFNA
ncbi:hypothetical protein TNCT_442651 [Trichonephila clavata]|uniref:Uncharacterized protein n=1 Tax=Trichonephila clavata TaxID=2740835 RepID=A0A8X6KMV9_TRICU|nr:hypothetical protein TNCT_442651 [Trichonephila clavata]